MPSTTPGDPSGWGDDPVDEGRARAADAEVEEASSHRGAFGDYGGSSRGFIDRSFRERIVVVALDQPPYDDRLVEEHLDELCRLVDTAGADVVGRITQRRHAPDPATYIGAGKVDEVAALARHYDCDTVVFDDELSPAQQLNLEKRLGRTAIDRTAVILDIFAQNASSLEGRAQVELAQLRYRLPRLRGKGHTMSQQGAAAGGARGPIGTRGPGETQLEVDRRRLVRRMHKLEATLRDVEAHRETQRKAGRRAGLPNVVLVGYTNAGKSTLLNRLTDAGVLTEDRLFATLDPTTRRLQLPGGRSVLLTDTVGFVRKLPHQLVEAFRSTLEVATDADLLVHVVDASSADPEAEIAAVHEVLREIGADTVDELLVMNKSDLVDSPSATVARAEGAVAISAATGAGVEDLLDVVGARLRSRYDLVELAVPYDRGDVMAQIHRHGEVLSETPDEHGVTIRARLAASDVRGLDEFVVDGALGTRG